MDTRHLAGCTGRSDQAQNAGGMKIYAKIWVVSLDN